MTVEERKPSKIVVVDAGGLSGIDDLLEDIAGAREPGFIFGLAGRLEEEVVIRWMLGEASLEEC